MSAELRKPHQDALTIETLGKLSDGTAGAVINAALRAAVRDADDRGGDGKPRKVVIEVILEKVGVDGNRIDATVRAKTMLPPYQTDPTVGVFKMDERGNPEMAFSPYDANRPDQPPLPGV